MSGVVIFLTGGVDVIHYYYYVVVYESKQTITSPYICYRYIFEEKLFIKKTQTEYLPTRKEPQ